MPFIFEAHEKDPEAGEYFSDHEEDEIDYREEQRHYTEWDI
jgi:hypothetical protein